MIPMTLDHLKTMMRGCSGVDATVDLDGDINDKSFRDIGYDSLAVLEMASQIQRLYGIEVPDEAIEDMRTPAHVLSFVNTSVAAA